MARVTIAALVAVTAWATTAAGQVPCCGDCDGSGIVSIGEVTKSINNFLGQCIPGYCPGINTPTATPTPTPGANDCCQLTGFCGPPSGGTCVLGSAVYAAGCSMGACSTFTPTPTATSTPTPCLGGFCDKGDGTVIDATTGLQWEKKSYDGGIHDFGNTYMWTQLIGGEIPNGTAFTTFLASLNRPPCFAGHCDWRLPTITELLSIVNYDTVDPAVFSAFNVGCLSECTITACSCTASYLYWTSSTYYLPRRLAWTVSFSGGTSFTEDKTGSAAARAVRGPVQ